MPNARQPFSQLFAVDFFILSTHITQTDIYHTTEAWKEYKKKRQSAKRVIFSAKDKKQKKCASDLHDPEHRNEIFRMAKQMVKERQDITRSNCLKGVCIR